MNSDQSTVSRHLAPSQVEAWRRDGFLVVYQFIDDATLTNLRMAYDRVLSRDVRLPGDAMLGDVIRMIEYPSSGDDTFAVNPAVELGIEYARTLLGRDDVARVFDMLIYKPPGDLHETPWHQDAAYEEQPFTPAGTPIRRASIQFWIPLDDVDDDNGCMHFVPGYQHLPVMEHYVASGDPAAESRLLALTHPDKQLDLSRVVKTPIPAGGATMHARGTPHYTGPNRTVERPRRAYIFNIAQVDAES